LVLSQRDDIVSPLDPDVGESEEPPRMTAIGPSIIGATMVLKGDLSLSEDLVIDGAFDGSITQGDQRLSIGESARVRATIRTGSAIIAGTVEGNIFGSRTVIVKRSARLHGALTAHRLCLETGANLEDVVLSGNIARTPVIDD
jgi:cytoskeletal protein CcmA (bactofilin family)